jgi:glycosyltransferase involved in cell wall biosynthesis
MMKVLYVITQGENGGAQKNVRDLVVSLSKSSDFKITVATGKTRSTRDSWLQNNTRNFVAAIHEFRHLVREIRPISDIQAVIDIYKYIRKEKFDIVHLHSSKAGVLGSIASKLAGARVVYTVHGFVFEEPMSLFKKYFYIFLELASSLFIDTYICVSKKDLSLGQKYRIIRKGRGGAVYNGLEKIDFPSKEKAREMLCQKTNIQDPRTVVGVVANLYPTKGLLYLIESAKTASEQRSDIVFAIIGEGSERVNLENKIKELGLQNTVFLLGFIENAATLIPGFDVLVLPSVKEGLPYILLEAARCGVPIIATSVGGIPEIREYITMELIPSKDSAALASAIIKPVYTPSSWNTVFELETMVASVAQIYETLYKK